MGSAMQVSMTQHTWMFVTGVSEPFEKAPYLSSQYFSNSAWGIGFYRVCKKHNQWQTSFLNRDLACNGWSFPVRSSCRGRFEGHILRFRQSNSKAKHAKLCKMSMYSRNSTVLEQCSQLISVNGSVKSIAKRHFQSPLVHFVNVFL